MGSKTKFGISTLILAASIYGGIKAYNNFQGYNYTNKEYQYVLTQNEIKKTVDLQMDFSREKQTLDSLIAARPQMSEQELESLNSKREQENKNTNSILLGWLSTIGFGVSAVTFLANAKNVREEYRLHRVHIENVNAYNCRK